MARRYPVWFLEGNIQAYLDEDTKIIYDKQGEELYQCKGGTLSPIRARGMFRVASDGRIVSENGNQAGFITDYQQFLHSAPAKSAGGGASGVKTESAAGGAKAENAANHAASFSGANPRTKKKTRAWVVLLLIAAAVFFSLNNQSGPVYDSVRAAGDALRQALLNHEDKVSFRYRSKTFYVTSSNAVFAGIGNNGDLIEAYRAATKHTGNPDEGDQLSLWANVDSGTMSAVEDKNGYIVTINAKLSYYTTKEQEEKLREKIKSIVSGLNLTGKSEYEKVRAIYNWICSHVTYDYAHLGDESYKMQYTAYNAVFAGTAVCSGYAQLFYRMALTAGLDARIKLNDNHAWNLVKIGGSYYYCDSTWDSGKKESQYEYFLKGSSDFQLHPSSLPLFGLDHSPLLTVDSNLPVSVKAYGK